MAELNMIQALNRALHDEMGRDDRVLVMGQDVGINGGIFRVTDGLYEKYGEHRVFDTPLAEAGIVGTATGLCFQGFRPVAEMQFSGFSYYAFHHVEAHLARYRKRSQGRWTVPMVVRMPFAAGVHALEHHSESRETYYAHTPGLKMVVPRSPRKAYDYLIASIRDPDPVIFYEPKSLYRRPVEEVPDELAERYDDEEPPVEIGKSEVVREGDDLTIVSYGAMLWRSMEAAERLADEDDVEAEVIDLCTLAPLDDAPVQESVRETGRCIVVHEAHRTLGIGAEVVARVNEKSMMWLEAPIVRVTGYDVQVPLFHREQDFLPDVDRIVDGARAVLGY